MARSPETELPDVTAGEGHLQPAPGGDQPAAKRPFPKPLIFGPLLVLILVATGYYIHGQAYEATDDAAIEGHVVPISAKVSGHIQKVYVDDNQTVKGGELLLELDPRDFEAQLTQARAALTVAEARRDAARINVALTSDTTRADVDQASSGVDMATSGLGAARAQVASARSLVKQAQAQIAVEQASASQEQATAHAAEAEATRTQEDLKRYQGLIHDGAISRQALDAATAAEKSARSNLESARQKATSAEAKVAAARAALQAAREGLHQAESNVGQAQAHIGEASGKLASANTAPRQVAATQSQLKALQGEVESARAALRQAELNLEYTKVYAPDDGRVTRKSAEKGAYVQLGQAFMAIVPKEVWIVANFKETQLAHMKPGQPVRIRVDAYPDAEFQGRVDSIQSGTGARFSLLPPENATGNFVKVVQRVPVKIVLDSEPDGRHLLAPGMSVEPRVTVK